MKLPGGWTGHTTWLCPISVHRRVLAGARYLTLAKAPGPSRGYRPRQRLGRDSNPGGLALKLFPFP